MATYGTKGGKITYTMKGQGGGDKKPSVGTSEAARHFASMPKSKAIRDPKVGYGGSKKRGD